MHSISGDVKNDGQQTLSVHEACDIDPVDEFLGRFNDESL